MFLYKKSSISVCSMSFILTLQFSAVVFAAPGSDVNVAGVGVTPSESSRSFYYLCKNSSAARTLRVTADGRRCVTTYTKSGVDEIVGRSTVHDRCVQVLQNIKENLEKANWKCRDISESRVSSSLDSN